MSHEQHLLFDQMLVLQIQTFQGFGQRQEWMLPRRLVLRLRQRQAWHQKHLCRQMLPHRQILSHHRRLEWTAPRSHWQTVHQRQEQTGHQRQPANQKTQMLAKISPNCHKKTGAAQQIVGKVACKAHLRLAKSRASSKTKGSWGSLQDQWGQALQKNDTKHVECQREHLTPNPVLPKAGVDAGVPNAGVEGCPNAWTQTQFFRAIRDYWLVKACQQCKGPRTGAADAPNMPPLVCPKGELAGCTVATVLVLELCCASLSASKTANLCTERRRRSCAEQGRRGSTKGRCCLGLPEA